MVVRDARDVVFIAKAAGGNAMFHSIQVGARLPAHATSTGQVLLANLPKADLSAWLKGRSLARITPQTEVGMAAFKKIIDQVRTQDHALSRDAHELGIHALAVPLRNIDRKSVV